MQAVEGDKIDKIVNLCSRRGIFFPTSEIYGAVAGFYDYGPIGVQLKRNVENSWWKFFITSRENMVGIDGAIITHPTVWKASGHVDAFNDPLVECKKCHRRFRADHLVGEKVGISTDGMKLPQLSKIISEKNVMCLVSCLYQIISLVKSFKQKTIKIFARVDWLIHNTITSQPKFWSTIRLSHLSLIHNTRNTLLK